MENGYFTWKSKAGDIMKHDEIYLKHDHRNVNQITKLHDINWKACLRKITSGGAIKDLDSSHPHYKRHDTN